MPSATIYSDLMYLNYTAMKNIQSNLNFDEKIVGEMGPGQPCIDQACLARLWLYYDFITRLILGLHPANERRRYFVTTSLIGWAQA